MRQSLLWFTLLINTDYKKCGFVIKTKTAMISIAVFLFVREVGLEPTCLCGATPSRWCVCQFRHSRAIFYNYHIKNKTILEYFWNNAHYQKRSGNFNIPAKFSLQNYTFYIPISRNKNKRCIKPYNFQRSLNFFNSDNNAISFTLRFLGRSIFNVRYKSPDSFTLPYFGIPIFGKRRIFP